MLRNVTLHPTRSPLWIALALMCFMVMPSSAQAQADQAVYTDSLVNGWQNWSWATTNLSASAPVQSGTASIGVTAGAWAALYLHHDAFDSSTYTDLAFWINGGPSGG